MFEVWKCTTQVGGTREKFRVVGRRNTVTSEWDAEGVMAVVRCKIGEVGRGQISQGLCTMPTKDSEY